MSSGISCRRTARRAGAGAIGGLAEQLGAVERYLEASTRHRAHLEERLMADPPASGVEGLLEVAHGAAREMLLDLGVPSRVARQAAERLDEELLEALNAADRAGMALCCAVRAARSAEELTAALGQAHLARLAEQHLAECLRHRQPAAALPARAGGWLAALRRPSAWCRVLLAR